MSVFDTLHVIRGSHRYNTWLYDCIKTHLKGRVLDIGSGLGDIARQFDRPEISEVILSDYDPQMLCALERGKLPLRSYRTLFLDISDPASVEAASGLKADTVTCINVLEHIEDDAQALRHIRRLMVNGGTLIVFVPALPAIYGTLDQHVEHCRRYTKGTLAAVFHKAGFTVQESYYMNMFGILTWFVAGRVLRQKKFHRHACRLLDRTVPALRALECMGPPPIGQSLVMVGRC